MAYYMWVYMFLNVYTFKEQLINEFAQYIHIIFFHKKINKYKNHFVIYVII